MQHDRALELAAFEALFGAGCEEVSQSARDDDALRTAAAESIRTCTAAAVDRDLMQWFGPNLERDPRLVLAASPILDRLGRHDVLAGGAARCFLRRLQADRRHRYRVLNGEVHILGDRSTSERRSARLLRGWYTGGPTHWPTRGRYLDLAVAEYSQAQRRFRAHLRRIVVHEREIVSLGRAVRLAVVRRHLRTLHPIATNAHAVRVLEHFGTDCGPGDLAAKVNRLQVELSRLLHPAPRPSRLTRRQRGKPKRKPPLTPRVRRRR